MKQQMVLKSVRVGCIEEKYRSSMNSMKVVASALLFTVIALAGTSAYIGMMEGNMTATVPRGDRRPVSERGTIGNDMRGDIVHALTGFSVYKLTDRLVHGALDRDSTNGVVSSSVVQFSGTREFLIPGGMDLHQSNSAFGAASGFRLLSW